MGIVIKAPTLNRVLRNMSKRKVDTSPKEPVEDTTEKGGE